jgi:hypothetical protein
LKGARLVGIRALESARAGGPTVSPHDRWAPSPSSVRSSSSRLSSPRMKVSMAAELSPPADASCRMWADAAESSIRRRSQLIMNSPAARR